MATTPRTWLPPIAGVVAAVVVFVAGTSLRDSGNSSSSGTSRTTTTTSVTAPTTTGSPTTAPTTTPGSPSTTPGTPTTASGGSDVEHPEDHDGGRPVATTVPGGPGQSPFAPAGAKLDASLETASSKDWVYSGTGTITDGCAKTKAAAEAAGYATYADCTDRGGPAVVQFSGRGTNGGALVNDGSVQITVQKP